MTPGLGGLGFAHSVWYTFRMRYYHLTAVIWNEGRRFVSKCPELGVASYGLTPQKAESSLKQAVELYLSNAKKLGLLADVLPVLRSESRYKVKTSLAARCWPFWSKLA